MHYVTSRVNRKSLILSLELADLVLLLILYCSTLMAVAARQITVEKGNDHIVAVERNIVYDEKTNTAAEVKKTVVLVDLGDGMVGQATQTEVTAIQLGAEKLGAPAAQRPAIRSPQPSPARAPPPRQQQQQQQQQQPAVVLVPVHAPAPQVSDPPPPSYSSTYRSRASTGTGLKSQVRDAKENKTSNSSFLFDVISIFTGNVCCLAVMIVLLALPAAMIAIGALFLNSCPGQPFIPLWALVYGCVSSAQLLLSVLKWCICRKKEDESDNSERLRKITTFIEVASVLFLVAWLIAGSVWVFTYFSHLDTLTVDCVSGSVNCCHTVVYWFSFGSIVAIYAFIFFTCCCCCYLFCTAIS